ncbi:arabinosyltransferase domain-containing protein [Nocardia sp. BMG111209]|uniref:arabinosyltransferase domain-containing protein n=1 Tax=Nocardia sp. BMG111209 TaxID=1160137 RepID=UPI000382D010|nr:arabinosyltransferase domain-containing protein [Nocardia sp. BMG111209]
MTDTMVRAGDSPTDEARSAARGSVRAGWAARIALLAGLLGAVFAIAVPLLPVHVDKTTLSWPQQGSSRSVTAPLVSYAPAAFDATVPCRATAELAAKGGLLASTMPTGAPDQEKYGFVARVRAAQDGKPAQLEAVLRNQSLVSVPLEQLGDCTLTVHADFTHATAELAGVTGVKPVQLTGDYRPQLVGLYSDLASPGGATMTAQVDSRFSVVPTVAKRIATVLALALTLVALIALFVLDRRDGRRGRLVPRRWLTFTGADAVVLGLLLIWYVIGATTSDDGYQFGMARTSLVSGYMANYFRYFGVPETPVGTPPYDLLAYMSHLSTASPWMRLPTLVAGVVCWLAISREVIPRLGVAVRHDRIAVWTGAFGFLAAWLPYNNGLRPEPVVAVCLLLTWCLMERAVATRRLLPYALAILVAAFSCTAAPSGVVCAAALLAGVGPVWRAGVAQARRLAGLAPGVWSWIRAYGALLAPLAAAGVLVLAVAFSVEPISAMFEMRRVHQAALPNDPWYNEYLRYQWLFMPTVDGSIARRFTMVALWLGMLASVFVLLRRGGRIPLLAAGPARRLLGTTFGAMLLMMTTPTKWTHQNGVYAGLAGAVAVLTAVAVGPKVLRSARNRALFGAVVALALAQVFTSVNGWWYVSSFGIPWWDKPPSVHGFALDRLFLLLAVLLLLLAGWFHVQSPGPGAPQRDSSRFGRLLRIRPLSVAVVFVVLFELGSFAKGAVAQYPAFSLARSNVDAVLGKPCGLAQDVLVETDPNAGLLPPLSGDPFATFTGGAQGFVPNGVGDLNPDDTGSGSSTISTSVTPKSGTDAGSETGGAALPFGLNSVTTPELGTSGQSGPAELTTGWYKLPADRSGIVAIAAAGRIRSVDKDGVVTGGQSVEIEYGTAASDGTADPLGKLTPLDIGPAPAWRNLRVPFADIPAQADVVRIVASARDRDPAQWLALTPPRVPQTHTLQDVVGSHAPVLLDWAVGLQFPCQRPFDHKDGIAQVPNWRILPDRIGAHDTTLWEDHNGGGPLGWTQELLRPQTVATYLKDDWRRDWGELQRFAPMDPTAATVDPTHGNPAVTVTQETHTGMWSPGHINTAW